jgi:RND family efflux transporter MFP subunit
MKISSRLLGQALVMVLFAACSEASKDAGSPPAPGKAALTVATTKPQVLEWPMTLKASGNIAAWQEAVIGPEINNYRITEVQANVGDVVKKGQILARIAPETVENELSESLALVAEAEATLTEARANNERARQLREKGFFSPQQSTQTQTVADTALARLNVARARLKTAQLKRSKATVQAPDDGIISARTATVGTLTETGQELFRLIRGGRLEWRAEVTSAELARLKPGQLATLSGPNGEVLEGVVRAIAPSVDPQTRNALVYVDLPEKAAQVVSAGMFARGEFRLGQGSALTLPQSAVLLREGFAYVFRVDNDKVTQIKIDTGRRNGERIEVSGLDPQAQIVASGGGFLADGDSVRVVPEKTASGSSP